MMTVYKVETVNHEQEVLKVLNPNLQFLLETYAQYIEQLLDKMEQRSQSPDKTKYQLARNVLAEVKEWIHRDVTFANFLEKDTTFRKLCENFPAPRGFDYQMYVPRSRGPQSRYFMREEYIEGENLTQWETLEQQGHDMKQIVSLIVQHYGYQLKNGMAHSDVHIGNFRVTQDHRVAILDRNFYLELNPKIRELINIFLNPLILMLTPPAQIVERMIQIAQKSSDISSEQKMLLEQAFDKAKTGMISGDWKSISHFLVELRKQGLRLPLEITLIFKNLNSLQQMSTRAGFKNLLQTYLYTPAHVDPTSMTKPHLSHMSKPHPSQKQTEKVDTLKPTITGAPELLKKERDPRYWYPWERVRPAILKRLDSGRDFRLRFRHKHFGEGVVFSQRRKLFFRINDKEYNFGPSADIEVYVPPRKQPSSAGEDTEKQVPLLMAL